MDLDSINHQIATQPGVLLYFSSKKCSVCEVLRPKVKALVERDFPLISFIEIEVEKHPIIAGQYRIFTSPTVLLFLAGKSYFRFARNISIEQLRKQFERPYLLMTT